MTYGRVGARMRWRVDTLAGALAHGCAQEGKTGVPPDQKMRCVSAAKSFRKTFAGAKNARLKRG